MGNGGRILAGIATSGTWNSTAWACIASSSKWKGLRKAGLWKASMTEGYVELHARSAFSFLEGASSPEALMVAASTLDVPTVALMDRDNVAGAVRFHNTAKKVGTRALV